MSRSRGGRRSGHHSKPEPIPTRPGRHVLLVLRRRRPGAEVTLDSRFWVQTFLTVTLRSASSSGSHTRGHHLPGG
jgi:hypothetical protein